MAEYFHYGLSSEERLYNRQDSTSFCNSHEATITHIAIEWDLDFLLPCISGQVELTVQILKEDVQYLHLDCCGLVISNQGILIEEKCVDFIISEPLPHLGSKLSIQLPTPFAIFTEFIVTIRYSTSLDSTAVQWLEPANTKGGLHPYLFTQCCLSHARSLLPCMDTPGVKATYYAKVACPKWCTVLMSGLLQSSQGNEFSQNIFEWKQPIPIPAYLIAIAAGNLASCDVSDRIKVWSEPEMVESAFFEFGETEKFLSIGESITNCPYPWGRYDILCLPPAFPKGGMENPCLTFATPTLLAGDRSLVNIIAHEISHSWTGNLVTNATWNHFWLNEGLTTWLERKILQRVTNSNEYYKLCCEDLQSDINQMGQSSIYTSLVWPLCVQNPDDAYSVVPYEKGFCLLEYLESIVGSAKFENFVQSYISSFKYKTVTSGEFRDFFVGFVDNECSQHIKDKVLLLDWEMLLLGTGFPLHPLSDYSSSYSLKAHDLASNWISIDMDEIKISELMFSTDDIEGWCSQQICLFLDLLLSHIKMNECNVFSAKTMRSMDELYEFTSEPKNAEIKFRWYSLSIQCCCDWVIPHAIEYIKTQGRMKFIRPLYRIFLQSDWVLLAIETFEANEARYHPIARKMILKDIDAAKQSKE